MAKKKIEIKKEYLEELLNDFYTISYSKSIIKKNLEEDVDDKVKELLKPLFSSDKVVGKKTGNKSIDSIIPSWHGETGSGRPDVMVYDYFNNEEISILIENKNFTSPEDPIPQAIHSSNNS